MDPSDTTGSSTARGGVRPSGIRPRTHVQPLSERCFRGVRRTTCRSWTGLRHRVWPMESRAPPPQHAAGARRASAIFELLSSGYHHRAGRWRTVHDTGPWVFEGWRPKAGIRATIGQVPDGLRRPRRPSRLQETAKRVARRKPPRLAGSGWHGAAGRPPPGRRTRQRFAVLVFTRSARGRSPAFSAEDRRPWFTRTRPESLATRSPSCASCQGGMSQTSKYLASPPPGVGRRLCTAHCVWVDEREQRVAPPNTTSR